MENQVIDDVNTNIKGADLSIVSPFEPNTGRVKHSWRDSFHTK